MISFEMEDLIGVLQGLKPYFIAIGVLLLAAIIITVAVGKKEKKLKSLIRKESWIAAVAGIAIVVNTSFSCRTRRTCFHLQTQTS